MSYTMTDWHERHPAPKHVPADVAGAARWQLEHLCSHDGWQWADTLREAGKAAGHHPSALWKARKLLPLVWRPDGEIVALVGGPTQGSNPRVARILTIEPIRRPDGKHTVILTVECPYCQRTHCHGAARPRSDGDYGHRAADCTTGFPNPGYYLHTHPERMNDHE